MVNESHEQGVLEENEAEMIGNIFEFGEKQASDVMTFTETISWHLMMILLSEKHLTR